MHYYLCMVMLALACGHKSISLSPEVKSTIEKINSHDSLALQEMLATDCDFASNVFMVMPHLSPRQRVLHFLSSSVFYQKQYKCIDVVDESKNVYKIEQNDIITQYLDLPPFVGLLQFKFDDMGC
jgi:hypothetical protein